MCLGKRGKHKRKTVHVKNNLTILKKKKMVVLYVHFHRTTNNFLICTIISLASHVLSLQCRKSWTVRSRAPINDHIQHQNVENVTFMTDCQWLIVSGGLAWVIQKISLDFHKQQSLEFALNGEENKQQDDNLQLAVVR